MISCADAAPDIMQAATTIAKADLHIHAPYLSNREPRHVRGDADRQRVIVLCDGVSGVERSERNVSIDNIARIARGLKVRASELLTDT